LDLLNQQLQAQPTNAVAMVNYAYVLLQNQQFTNALPYLDRALALRPRMVEALLNRAIANLRSERFDAALADYKSLESVLTSPSHEVYYGLGEIYFQKKDRKLAQENFKQYLKFAPLGLPERRFVEDRIKALEDGAF
jgi:tetratricopeptide (TPR) repeat protein